MVNRVILIGNLGRDPEVRRLENGAVVAKFPIATNENYKDSNGNWQQLTEWHDIIVWRQLAERAESSLKKGMAVYVEGKITHRKWTDKDGNNRYSTEIVSNYFRVINREKTSPGYFPSANDEPSFVGRTDNMPPAQAKPSTIAPATNGSTPNPTSPVAEDVVDNADDDLPF